MRGQDVRSDALFSYVSCEARVPKDHPLRPIRRIVDEALTALSPEFEKLPPLATGGPPLWENQATPSQGGPAVRIRLPPRGVRDPGGRSPSRSRYTPRTG